MNLTFDRLMNCVTSFQFLSMNAPSNVLLANHSIMGCIHFVILFIPYILNNCFVTFYSVYNNLFDMCGAIRCNIGHFMKKRVILLSTLCRAFNYILMILATYA
jgi:dimeric dUTPase (all-alpha-NTP-PPase superfamily)